MSSGILRGLKLPLSTALDMDFHIVLTRKQTKTVKANLDLYRILDKDTRFDFCDLEYQLYYPLDFRVVSVEISPGVWEYLITNLDRDSFSPVRLKKLYHHRWGIETSFRDLKHTIGLENFHSKRAEFITQEVFARLILYNLCELVATHAAIFCRTASHVYQLNFSAAVHIVRHALFFLKPDASPPDVVTLIHKYLLPLRPDRSDPRKVRLRSSVSFLYRVA
jgi:IS4 transposase